MKSWLYEEEDEEWSAENTPELNRPFMSYPLWIACRAVEFAHLPGGMNIEEQPDWLVQDFALYSARYAFLQAAKRKEEEK